MAATTAERRNAGSPSATATPSPTTTERGADGWPSAATPEYLIPAMGKVPVSSTAHFRTVVMTRLGDADFSATLWPRLRAPLLRALGQPLTQDAPKLVVHKAVYGDFALNLGELPTTSPVDVRLKVLPFVRDDVLAVPVDNLTLGDPAPGRAKALEVVYRLLDGEPLTKRVAENGNLVVPGTFRIVEAHWGEGQNNPGGDTAEVTGSLQGKVSGNHLSVLADNSSFGTNFISGRPLFLRVDYAIDGVTLRQTFPQGAAVALPGPLTVVSAHYGEFLPPRTVDVTPQVAQLVNQQSTLEIVASSASFGDPAPGIAKKLHIDFSLGGVAGSRVIQDGERLTLGGAAPQAVDATAVHQLLFEPPPASLADLARRLTLRGLKATDLDPAAPLATLEDVLNQIVGLAPDDVLDPLQASADAVDTPAEGVLLHHEQGWFGRGMALGNLLHSVALAPGEVTQIAMTHWNHTTRATDSETVSQEDSAAESDTQDRAVSEIQRAAASEHASGGSSAASAASSAQAGISSFFGSASAATSANLTTAVSHSDGSKNLSMDSNQRIAAVTQRHAEAARTRRATVVREVTQSEDQSLTTRVLANYNHMHALTIMYFEVIEVFDLKTRVVDAERVVFLPFKVRDVRELIPRYRVVLIDAANAAGKPDLAEAFRHHTESPESLRALAASIARLDGPMAAGDPGSGEIARAVAKQAQWQAALDGVPARFAGLRAGLQASITDLNSQRALVFAAFKDVPGALGGIAAQAVQAQFQALDRQLLALRAQIDVTTAAEDRAGADAQSDLAASGRQIDALMAQSRQLNAARRMLQALVQPGTASALDDNRLYFNQAVWISLSPGEVLGLARRRGRFQGEALAEHLDPEPVAVSGNCVAYRWHFDDAARTQAFKQRYVEPFVGDPDRELATVTTTIASPTGGVFGEAVLGQAISAEKIDLSRFWNWQDSMIPILPTGINALSAATPSVQNLSAEPGKLDESSAKLSALPDLPAPAGLQALAESLRAQLFRDMSGQAVLQTLAEATTKAAASGAADAGRLASENFKAGLDFTKEMAPTVLAALAAPETGGASLLAGKLNATSGGGTSLLGGILSAGGVDAAGGLLSSLVGGKASLPKKAIPSATKGAPPKNPDKAAPTDPKTPASKLEDTGPAPPAAPAAGA